MVVSTHLSTLTYSHTIGLLALTGRGFSNPFDLALGQDGRIYVLNRSNFNHAPMDAVRVGICTLDEQYLGEFGSFGETDGLFTWPSAITVDRAGNVYVADEHRHDVQVFDTAGQFVRKVGSYGSGAGQLDRPCGLATTAQGTILVTDHLNHRIQERTPEGTVLRQWGSAGSGPGEFNLPWGICVDQEGCIYVADWRNDRIQKFTATGDYLATIGSPGSGDGQLHRPSNLAVADDGAIFVTDWGNERVCAFAADGTYLTSVYGDSAMSTWGAEAVASAPDLIEGRAEAHDLSAERRFFGPTAVEVDRQGNVIVVDSCRHRLQVYRRA